MSLSPAMSAGPMGVVMLLLGICLAVCVSLPPMLVRRGARWFGATRLGHWTGRLGNCAAIAGIGIGTGSIIAPIAAGVHVAIMATVTLVALGCAALLLVLAQLAYAESRDAAPTGRIGDDSVLPEPNSY